jgi:outer membrane protein assembly factor BamB
MNTVILRNGLVFGIVTLFIVSAVNPIVFGYKIRTSNEVELPSPASRIGGLTDSAWPMFQHDTKHTGRSPFGKSGNWRIVKWIFKIDHGMFFSSPAIDKDGIIYIGGYDRYLYAIYANGTEKWRFKTDEGIESSPAIADDGTIYVGSNEGLLYAIYPNGTKKWSIAVGHGAVDSSPIIDDDGIIYTSSWIGKNFCALYPNGTRKWDIILGGYIFCTPCLDENGIVYIGTNDGYMYAIYTCNGTIKWKYGTNEKIGSAPTIDDNDIIYFGSNDGYLYAVYPNGTTKWKFLTKPYHGLVSSPAIAEDGSIIVGSGLGYVYSISPDGAENWRFSAGADVSASPAIDKYGIIYVGAWNGMFYALNPDGTLRWKYKALDYVLPSAAIGEGGTIYFASDSETFQAYLYAIEPINDDPPDKPSISGLTSGGIKTEYTYTAETSDPDGDDVSYFFDWGDGSSSGWTEFVPSGTSVSRDHSWQRSGTYTIRVKAKDVYDYESNWKTLTVTMPRNRATVLNSLLLDVLNQFPLLQKLLSLLF